MVAGFRHLQQGSISPFKQTLLIRANATAGRGCAAAIIHRAIIRFITIIISISVLKRCEAQHPNHPIKNRAYHHNDDSRYHCRQPPRFHSPLQHRIERIVVVFRPFSIAKIEGKIHHAPQKIRSTNTQQVNKLLGAKRDRADA